MEKKFDFKTFKIYIDKENGSVDKYAKETLNVDPKLFKEYLIKNYDYENEGEIKRVIIPCRKEYVEWEEKG